MERTIKNKMNSLDYFYKFNFINYQTKNVDIFDKYEEFIFFYCFALFPLYFT